MASLDPKSYYFSVEGVDIPIDAFADDPNAFTVPDEHAIFEVELGGDGKRTFNKNPDNGGPIGLLIRPGSRVYAMLEKWSEQLRQHEGSVPFISGKYGPRGDAAAGEAPSESTGDGTYRPLSSYSCAEGTLQMSPRGPNRGTTAFTPGRFTFEFNEITKDENAATDDGIPGYPGLDGEGGGAGGGGGLDQLTP